MNHYNNLETEAQLRDYVAENRDRAGIPQPVWEAVKTAGFVDRFLQTHEKTDFDHIIDLVDDVLYAVSQGDDEAESEDEWDIGPVDVGLEDTRRARKASASMASDEPQVDSEEYENLRADLHTLLQADAVRRYPSVRKFRSRHLRNGLLTEEQAARFVQDLLPSDTFFNPDDDVSVKVPFMGYDRAAIVDVRFGTNAHHLWTVAHAVSCDTGWSMEVSVRYLLTGIVPEIASLQFDVHWTCNLWPRFTLTAYPWVHFSRLRQHLRRIREVATGKKSYHISMKRLKLVEFVLERKLLTPKPPSWAEMRREWNRAYPDWSYIHERGMTRDFTATKKLLIHPERCTRTRSS